MEIGGTLVAMNSTSSVRTTARIAADLPDGEAASALREHLLLQALLPERVLDLWLQRYAGAAEPAAATGDGEGSGLAVGSDLLFYGPIMEDGFWAKLFNGVTPSRVRKAISELEPGPGPVRLRFNSPGGSVFAGGAIRSMLDDLREDRQVTSQVDGMAASMASVLMLSGDPVRISPLGMVFVHDAQLFIDIFGRHTVTQLQERAERLHADATYLKGLNEQIVQLYAAKSSASLSRLRGLMLQETALDANAALQLGLVDSILSP